jgi:hypothetical protein
MTIMTVNSAIDGFVMNFRILDSPMSAAAELDPLGHSERRGRRAGCNV